MLYSKSLLVMYFKYSSLYMSILVALIFQPGALNTVLILDCVRDWRDPQGLANGGSPFIVIQQDDIGQVT